MATMKEVVKRKVSLVPIVGTRRIDEWKGKIVTTRVTAPGRLDEGKTMYKFPLRLPVPVSDEQAKKCYNLSMTDLIVLGVKNLATRLDGPAKAILFAIPGKPGEVFGANDVEGNLEVITKNLKAAQEAVDGWRWTERRARVDSQLTGAKTAMLETFANLGVDRKRVDGINDLTGLVAYQQELIAKATKKG